MVRNGFFSFITDHRKRLLKRMPKESRCAEIGVWRGDFSKRILDVTKPKELHLIDPWRFQASFPTTWYGGAKASNQSEMDSIFNSVRNRFDGFAEVCFHRKPSQEAHSDFPDNFFDWVYIDGGHDYDSVKADLELYLTKIKPQGFLTGDDYYLPSEDSLHPVPIRDAVEEFVKENEASIVKIIGSQFIIQRN